MFNAAQQVLSRLRDARKEEVEVVERLGDALAMMSNYDAIGG